MLTEDGEDDNGGKVRVHEGFEDVGRDELGEHTIIDGVTERNVVTCARTDSLERSRDVVDEEICASHAGRFVETHDGPVGNLRKVLTRNVTPELHEGGVICYKNIFRELSLEAHDRDETDDAGNKCGERVETDCLPSDA